MPRAFYSQTIYWLSQLQTPLAIQTQCQSPLQVRKYVFIPIIIAAYNVVPNMYLLEDYARQIGIDMQNNELHGYINPYAYEINR